MIVCPQCGADNREDLQSCRMCLSPLAEATASRRLTRPPQEFVKTIIETSRIKIECQQCAALNEPGFHFCQQCGTRLPKAELPADSATLEIANLSPATPPAEQKKSPIKKVPVEAPPEPTAPLSRQTIAPESYKTTPANEARLCCPDCNHEVQTGSLFCNLCGARLSVEQTVVMPSPKPPPKFRLRLIVDGEESGEVYELAERTVIGRTKGDVNFPYDDYMSSRHASVSRDGNRFLLKDEGSRNGTFFLLSEEIELKPGDVFMVGKQLFKFEAGE